MISQDLVLCGSRGKRSNGNVDRPLTRVSLMGDIIERDIFNCKGVNWYSSFAFLSS